MDADCYLRELSRYLHRNPLRVSPNSIKEIIRARTVLGSGDFLDGRRARFPAGGPLPADPLFRRRFVLASEAIEDGEWLWFDPKMPD